MYTSRISFSLALKLLKARQPSDDDGFTLIELLVTVSTIGVLAAIGLPSFASYLNRAKEAKADVHLSAVNRAQQAYRLENNRFASSLDALSLADSDGHYSYAITVASRSHVVVEARPQDSAIKGYKGVAYVLQGEVETAICPGTQGQVPINCKPDEIAQAIEQAPALTASTAGSTSDNLPSGTATNDSESDSSVTTPTTGPTATSGDSTSRGSEASGGGSSVASDGGGDSENSSTSTTADTTSSGDSNNNSAPNNSGGSSETDDDANAGQASGRNASQDAASSASASNGNTSTSTNGSPANSADTAVGSDSRSPGSGLGDSTTIAIEAGISYGNEDDDCDTEVNTQTSLTRSAAPGRSRRSDGDEDAECSELEDPDQEDDREDFEDEDDDRDDEDRDNEDGNRNARSSKKRRN